MATTAGHPERLVEVGLSQSENCCEDHNFPPIKPPSLFSFTERPSGGLVGDSKVSSISSAPSPPPRITFLQLLPGLAHQNPSIGTPSKTTPEKHQPALKSSPICLPLPSDRFPSERARRDIAVRGIVTGSDFQQRLNGILASLGDTALDTVVNDNGTISVTARCDVRGWGEGEGE